jgi:hypothetical protein
MSWLDDLGSTLLDVGSQVAPAIAGQYGGPIAGMAAKAALQAVKEKSVKSALPDAVKMLSAAAPAAMQQIPPGLLSQLSALLPALTQGNMPGLGGLVPPMAGFAAPALPGFDLSALLQAATGRR